MVVIQLVSILALLIILGFVAFYRLGSFVWSTLFAIALTLITIFSLLSPIPLLVFWLLFLTAAIFANLTELRRQYIVGPMIPRLKTQMPPISETERIAIEAGDTWWEKDLFCGSPNWKKLLTIPEANLSAEEQAFLDNQVEKVCTMVNDFDVVYKNHDLSPQVWDYLKQEKFFGLIIPKQYGGLGFSAIAHSTIVMKLASRSITAAVTTMVPNSLGPGELILKYGTEEQKNYYLPRLASGEDIPCFALTAPDAGSDAGSIIDQGIVCKGMHEGKEVLGMRVTWNKRYITLAPVANVLGLAIQLYDPEHLLSDKEDIGITLCLIPTNHPGVEIGERHMPMYQAFMNGPTTGKDVFIPIDWIIGGNKMLGQGWRMLMESLSVGRSISIPALATASCKGAYRYTGAYARIRRQFNTSISNFEGIQEALGYIAGFTYIANATRSMTAGAIDLKINPSIVSAITKFELTELARRAVNYGMDIQGGHGIQMGPHNLLGHVYLATPISITVEGANILTRNLIIFGQGAIRCHPYILKEVELLSSDKTSVNDLDDTLMSHIGFYASNLIRSMVYGFTGGVFIFSPFKNRRIAKLHRQIARMSTALALLADTSLIMLGGSLKRRERLSARLADILGQLYLASAVLKYFNDNNSPIEDVDNVCWALQYLLERIQISIDQLCANFPNRFVGGLLRFAIFPFGRAYVAPSDKLHAAVVAPMLSTGDLRKRVTENIFVSPDPNEISSLYEAALGQVEQVEPLYKKLHKSVQENLIPAYNNFDQRVEMAVEKGILTRAEAQTLRDYEKIRLEIIQVSDFSHDLNKLITKLAGLTYDYDVSA